MSDLSVTERRLRPILDAVATRNWKQALQQCDKWQKKGEKSDRFLAVKASILVNQPDKSQFERGKSETLQLCRRTPAVTDIEALYQLQDSLKHLALHREEGPKLWERAIAARPDDKDLLATLLNGSISDGNWMSAQKAAMALRKAFPKERQYEFWNMLLCYLIYQEGTLPQKDRDLFGRLAYMLMSKSAASVPSDKNDLLAIGKAISTPEELSLLIKIYIATEHADEALNLLQSPSLGLQSRVADLDPQFSFSLLLEVLSACKDQAKVLEICKTLIQSGSPVSTQHAGDDRLWKIFQSASRSDDLRARIDVWRQFAQSVYQTEPTCRPAYLTFFDLATYEPSDSDNDQRDSSLVDACIAYFAQFSQKPFCFGDLVRPLLSTQSSLESFVSHVQSKNDNDLQKAFALKLDHAHPNIQVSDAASAKLFNIATQAIELHKRLPKEKSECPEMVLLAATSLLRLALITSNNNYDLQASHMLETGHAKFGEYYPTAIRQVQLYLTSGQISLAMEKFASLAIKNMQWETVGHLLLNRISTLHPWQTRAHFESSNPLAALDAGLTMLISADQSLDKAIHAGLKHGSYSNIIDAINVKSNMNKSMNRQIFIIEERRIQRIVGIPQDMPLDPLPTEMVDQRDFSFLPDLGPYSGYRELEASLCCGPCPKELWLMAMGLHDHLATYIKAELASQTTLADLAYKRLETLLGKCEQKGNNWNLELTPAECSSLMCERTLSEALLLLSKNIPVTKQEDFDRLVAVVATWLDTMTSSAISVGIAKINGIETPTWEFIHTSYTQLATIQNISWFLSLQARRSKSSKSGKAITISGGTLRELQKQVTDAESSIHTNTKHLKHGINASGVLSRLVDAAAGRVEEGDADVNDASRALAEAFIDLVDEAALEQYCGSIKESWEDALDGILKVKIKVVK